MTSPPTGTVTFVFTDIEGSTKLWEQNPSAMQVALARHDEILRYAIETNSGHVFKTVGDAFCAAFASAPAALGAALSAQRALCAEEWDEGCTIRARMALHTGTASERGGDYFGPPVNRVARLLSAGHGGQILLSGATNELLAGDKLPADVKLRDQGERRLRDLMLPERVFQVLVPDLPENFPPLKTLDARPANLPVQITSLVGREQELEKVRGLLRRNDVRLLTLTGPGGTGKTRLALQAAADVLDEYEDGVCFVALAAVNDPAFVPATIAQNLGVAEVGGQPLLDTLKEYLKERELLVVLDNFEQVLGAAGTVAELLAVAGELKVVVTSRASLHVYGEREFAVPPLAVPRPVHPADIDAPRHEAVRLFVERAQAVRPDFAITNENATAVAEICARLDGLPLAIELAAARVRVLDAQQMLVRLRSRLSLLTGGAHDLPARQRTLRDTIEWSYDLLDETERTLFARLAVFAGGCTLGAVETICGAGSGPDLLDTLGSLVDKSLLRFESWTDTESRYVMLETLREYASDRLEASGEAGKDRRQHAVYYLTLAEQAEPEIKGSPRQVEWLRRLEAEHDNLRAALSWMLEQGESEFALRLAGASRYFWFMRGYLSEGRRWLEAALAGNSDGSDASAAKALLGLGAITMHQGEYRQAKKSLEKGIALLRRLGDARGLGGALNNLGNVALYEGRYEEATPLYEESLAWWRESGEKYGAEGPLGNLGNLAVYRGEYVRARQLYEESLQLARDVGDRHGVAVALGNLGTVAVHQQDYGRATKLQMESLTLVHELGDLEGVAYGLEGIADTADAQGRVRRAARLWAAARVLRESIGAPLPTNERPDYERRVTAARDRSGGRAWETWWEEGTAMTTEEAVYDALEEGANG